MFNVWFLVFFCAMSLITASVMLLSKDVKKSNDAKKVLMVIGPTTLFLLLILSYVWN